LIVWNLLDFAACTLPVTFADKNIDKARDMREFKSMSEIDVKIQADYDPEFYHGAPVSLQLVGKRLEEEKVLEMVEIVADALKNQT
jgi:amidase